MLGDALTAVARFPAISVALPAFSDSDGVVDCARHCTPAASVAAQITCR
jgi:hypothetical protein